MNSEQVKDIMKVALELKERESMSIEVPSRGQGLSLRTMFYRERLKVLQSGVAMNVSISSIEQRNYAQWIVVFTYEKPLQITVHKVNGSSSTVPLDTRVTPAIEKEIPDDIGEILKKHRERKEEEGEIKF
ncbi:MAG: hypothetical protein IMF19_04570 [Proteobacteria bacterium]|nr:hypothetical protein [Pseudomonadota bacterium]